MRDHRLNAIVIGAVLMGWTCAARSQEVQPAMPPTPPMPPSLDRVKWAGRPVSFAALKGKTVVVLVYATWCPKSNAWSGEFFTQLRTAIKDKPVVVVAINADENPSGVKQYLTERGFFAPNILHGYDPSMPKRLGFESNLYNFVLFGPDGVPIERGSGGRFFHTADGRQFALSRTIANKQDCGTLDFITPDMPDEVKTLFWPWELGVISESAVKSARAKLGPEQKTAIDTAIERYLNGQLELIREQYKGTVPERIEAYEASTALAGTFKATSQSKKAKAVVAFMNKDGDLKRELAAKKTYEGALRRAAADPKRRAKLMRTIAKRFEGAHYGKLAEEAAAAVAP